jgi:hypothetical protein
VNDDDDLDRRIRDSLTTWAQSIEAEPDLDALAARRPQRPWDHRGARVLGIAAAILLLAAAFSALQGPDPETGVSTGPDERSKVPTTETDPRGRAPDTTTTTSISSTTSTTAGTTPNSPSTLGPTVPSEEPEPPPGPTPPATEPDGNASPPTSGPDQGGPPDPTDCVTNEFQLMEVLWVDGDRLGLFVAGTDGSTQQVGITRHAADLPGCHRRVTDGSGQPFQFGLPVLVDRESQSQGFMCERPSFTVVYGRKMDDTTWEFEFRTFVVEGFQARLTNGYWTSISEPDQIERWRTITCPI